MGRIVTVNVVDLTRPIEQKGFKSVALVDFTASATTEAQIITDTTGIASDRTDMIKCASAFFTNGGSSLIIADAVVTSGSESVNVKEALDKIKEDSEFYILNAIIAVDNQAPILEAVKTWVEGNKCLAVVEINGEKEIVAAMTEIENSDRIVAYANKALEVGGQASATTGVCAPQDEGSITWGNKAVTGVSTSGYSLADETVLQGANINYITKEKGLVITQFGRTTSGSNADITRSKDWLENRCAESLTSTLINNKKVPFTTEGMAMISSSLNQVGVQAVSMGMLDSFYITTPAVSDIPTNDKANRILRGVKFIATLSGAVETIEMELQVKL